MLKTLNIAIKKLNMLPRREWASRVKLGVRKYLTDYPYYLSLQTVSACNLKCKHCFINDYHTHIHDGVVKIMRLPEFKQFAERLRPMIRKAAYFQFSTFEAILNKHLFEMMDILLEINPRLEFPFLSNTMELSAEKIRQLEKYPIYDVNVSLDGCTKKTVEDFKTGVVFEKIIDTINLLKQSGLRDKISVTFVAHANNIHELPDYIDFVHRLGVNRVYVSNILTFTKDLEPLALYTRQGNTAAEALFAEAIRRAKQYRLALSMPRLKPEKMGCQSCEIFFVDINGNVAPCDFLAVTTPFTLWGETVQHPPVIFGNILRDDPIRIYRKKEFKAFRMAHRVGKELPEQCTHCIDAYGLMCSNRLHYTA